MTRSPQHSADAEKGLIGACLRDNLRFFEIGDSVLPADFYVVAHRVVWTAMLRMFAKGKPIDLVTLAGETQAVHVAANASGKDRPITEYEELGGAKYLAQLWDEAPVVGNAKHYADIVRHKAMLREIYHVGNDLLAKGDDPTTNPDELVEDAAKSLFDVQQRTFSRKAVSLSVSVKECMASLDRKASGLVDTVKSGWYELDNLCGGFHRGELIVLAARPSVGKTVVALNIANYVASLDGRVLFASLEQSREDLASRLICMSMRVDSHKMRQGRMSEYEKSVVCEQANFLSGYGENLHIDDAGGQTVAHINMTARRQKMRQGLDLLIVDYMQLMKPADHSGTRNDQVAAISAGLKQIAKDLHIPVLALSQLSRGGSSRGANAEPELTDLRDSGAIEQDADTVIMIHTTAEPGQEPPDIQEIFLLVRKQRNGPRGRARLNFHRKFFKIENFAMQSPRFMQQSDFKGADYAVGSRDQ